MQYHTCTSGERYTSILHTTITPLWASVVNCQNIIGRTVGTQLNIRMTDYEYKLTYTQTHFRITSHNYTTQCYEDDEVGVIVILI